MTEGWIWGCVLPGTSWTRICRMNKRCLNRRWWHNGTSVCENKWAGRNPLWSSI
jgi:hypothetical protein